MYFAVTDFVSSNSGFRLHFRGCSESSKAERVPDAVILQVVQNVGGHSAPHVPGIPKLTPRISDVGYELRLQLKREIRIARIEIGVSNSLLPRPGSTCRDAAMLR